MDDVTCQLLEREKELQTQAECMYSTYNRFTRYYADEPLIYGGIAPENISYPMNKIGTEPAEYEIPFLCRRENGTYITPRTLQHTSKVIHKQIGIEKFDFHSLRHTHTTMLIEHGAPPIYVQKRLGHKNMDTTLNIYANHMTDTFREQGTIVLNNIY